MRPDESISALLLPLMYTSMGNPYPAMMRELRRSETLAPDDLADLQLTRLQTLTSHAYANVPYYRDLFGTLGVEPGDIRTMADYAKLPVLEKTTVQLRGPEFLASNHSRESLHEVTTSGSSGTPLTVYYDPTYFDWGWAAMLRDMEWTGYRLGERQVWLTRENTGGWKRSLRLALERKWVAGTVVQTPDTIAKWAAELQRRRPRLVYSTPSSRLSELSAYLLEHDIHLEGIRAVMTSSETLLDNTRRLIEDAFGAKVFDQYGSTECLAIASECPAGHLHVNAEINLVEYAPLGSAQGASEVIITPLMNHGMPLLRYRLGDLAIPVEGLCECGRTLPRMRLLAGRTASAVTLSDGSVITPFSLEELIQGVPGVVRFQFRQIKPDMFDLLVVKASPGDTSVDEALAEIDVTFERNNGIRLSFRVHYVDEIPLTEAGKHLYVVPLNDEAPREAGRF